MTTSLLAYIPSPSQGVWHLGFLPIRAYALCIITGIVAALVIGDRRWVARGGQPGVIYDIALWAVPFGLIGGRLYHVMTDWPTYFGDNGAGFLAALRIWDGGLGIWGAVALGGVGAWIACRRRGIPLPAFADAVAPGIVLAQAIGRLGNYFNQELYGRVTTMPWGLEIFERRDANGALDTLNGVSTGEQLAVVHPTFLYELLWNLLIFAVLIWADRRFRIGHGRLFALYVAGYCVGRFWIELMRSDHATEFGGIRVNTFTSTFVFIAAVVYIMVATKGREDPASLVGNDIDEDSKTSLPEKVAVGAGAAGVATAVVADKSEPADGDSDTADTPNDGVAKTASDTEAVPETEGLGAVEGDEVAAATEDAADANAAIVDEAAEAEELAADVAETESKPEADVEPDAVPDAEPDAKAKAATEPEADPDDLGSVDGDEVAAAVADAPEANAAIAEDAADANELAADVAEPESKPEVDVSDDEAESETDGLGSVDGDELAAAAEDASEANAAIVDETAEADELASEVAEPETEADVEAEAEADVEPDVDAEADSEADPEPEADPDPEPEAEDIGSVEGDEVAAAVVAAPKIHAAAARKATKAEDLEAEAAEESEAGADADEKDKPQAT